MSEPNLIQSLSFYAPIIICVGIVLFSMFISTIGKMFAFLLAIFVVTSLRILVITKFGPFNILNPPEICLRAISPILIPNDFTYSTYILSFTMAYFITPMILLTTQSKINVMNYGVLSFFIAYIALDIFVKTTLKCISDTNGTILIIGEIMSGIFLGGIISGLIMYGTRLKPYLYINEMNSNKEVCSLPSKQQFKCKVYKDGTLVGDL